MEEDRVLREYVGLAFWEILSHYADDYLLICDCKRIYQLTSMAYDPRQNSWFKFLVHHLNFKPQQFILQLNSKFYTLLLDFTSLENVFTLVFWLFNSTFVFGLARCRFSTRFVNYYIVEPCNFQLDAVN